MKRLLLGTVLSALAGAACAADMSVPVYKAPLAAVVSAGGWYLSVDGAWQRVNLPNYALGFHLVPDVGKLPLGQRFDGYFVRGAFGYFLPGAAHTIFGSNTRVEVGGLFGHASGSTNEAVTYIGGAVVRQNLNGAGVNSNYLCSPGQICTVNGNSSGSYSNWQVAGKVAGDYRFGVVAISPSLALFGGNAHNDQTMVQVLLLSSNPNNVTYNASTSLRWIDVGARAGLDLKIDATPWAEIGIGGWAGFASRRASLSGSDAFIDTFFGNLNGASTISGIDSSATPVLANAEAKVAIKPLPGLIVRGFVGLNYDSKVPGVSSPSFTGSSLAPTSRTPAGISFHSETSYYTGGGLTWTFGPVASAIR